ncbi:hypothetical protein V8G54_018986 [Vigna mungo]|uniref:Receptor-like serine/threonine-protein kinase n=1 Tax=Vigna mungo TaxID=3915 RepID=A0AAQ3N947_VIGMU
MVFTLRNRVLCFIIIIIIITFTCFLQLAKPSNLREDTLLQGHPLAATDRLISPSSLYTLRFFQLDDGSEANTKFYLGISANKYYYYVWLANRDNPIHDDPGVLTIDEYGNLKIVSSTTTMMLYSVEAESNKSVRASLLDTGNFVLHELNLDGSVKRVLWQSFDYPTDTILPGMKLGYDKHSGHKWSLTARRSYKTLWSGSFSFSLDPKINQLITRWRGDIIWASGEWRNGSFSNLKSSSLDRENFNFTFFSNESVTYFEYSPVSGYLIMGPLGIINATGVSYSCVGSEIVPGCTMPQPPKCREDDLYLPSWNSFGAMSRKGYIFDERENMTISDCWMRCLKNCSCEAYTYAFKDATGCEIWSRYTSHFVESNSGVGRPIFFFLSETKAKGKKRRIWIACSAVGVLLLILSFTASFIITNVFSDIGENTEISDAYDEGREEWNEKRTGSDTHKFDFITILQATDNFSLANKIGEGGFGPVYKGKLANGEEIAIKRLSKRSGQGLVEFRNEAMLIVKLQHTNLVRLLGFCIDREERILVYEYMANKKYALSGVISTKTDVYSFGVLLLEIVTGKKNISDDFSLNLIGYAWQLWNEGEALKLIDRMVNGSCHQIQVIRCIHIGLLCTQDKAKDRPSMLETYLLSFAGVKGFCSTANSIKANGIIIYAVSINEWSELHLIQDFHKKPQSNSCVVVRSSNNSRCNIRDHLKQINGPKKLVNLDDAPPANTGNEIENLKKKKKESENEEYEEVEKEERI